MLPPSSKRNHFCEGKREAHKAQKATKLVNTPTPAPEVLTNCRCGGWSLKTLLEMFFGLEAPGTQLSGITPVGVEFLAAVVNSLQARLGWNHVFSLSVG